MTDSRLADGDRLERRLARRRRQARQRRLVALSVVSSILIAVVGSVALRGEASSPATGPDAVPISAAKPRHPGTRRMQASPPAEWLGSGRPVTLAFAGDVHFERPIRERLASAPASVLARIAPSLRKADVAMLNLETAITDRGTPAAKEYTFRAPSSGLAALASGGVDVVTVANNHGLDYGLVGLRDTLAAARRSGIGLVGAGSNADRAYAPLRRTVNGQRIAIIGATQVLDDHLIAAWSAGKRKAGLASAKRRSRLLEAVRAARAASDTVVVYLHWGRELSSCPTRAQRTLAARVVGAGADVVVGSHAHVLLGAGRLRTALVAYGLGNFVFYAFRERTTQTGVLEVTVTGRRIDGYRWLPARISDGIPHPLAGSEAAAASRRWRALRACTGLRP